MDGCIVVPFTQRFSQLSPAGFIEEYLVEFVRPREIFVGDDFRFGQNRRGTLDDFQEAGKRYGFHLNVMPSIKGGRGKISSTDIRRYIAEGRLKRAERFLGRSVSLMGVVQKGDGRGKKFGFPTANIYPEKLVLPPLGVYAVRVRIGEKIFYGMANMGRRPSFPAVKPRIYLEVHIFHFRESIYGEEIIVEFARKIRRERTFPSQDCLIEQLKKDEIKAKKILNIGIDFLE